MKAGEKRNITFGIPKLKKVSLYKRLQYDPEFFGAFVAALLFLITIAVMTVGYGLDSPTLKTIGVILLGVALLFVLWGPVVKRYQLAMARKYCTTGRKRMSEAKIFDCVTSGSF